MKTLVKYHSLDVGISHSPGKKRPSTWAHGGVNQFEHLIFVFRKSQKILKTPFLNWDFETWSTASGDVPDGFGLLQ